ncbi:hypothetical protein ACO0LF_27325 [Undibacterium sp. Di27W]|uniref:hypothetical protein n=1 Tax=Undibacterium sp. Di27W TaxID=3413036 RepID=UPI003BF00E6C
MKTPSKYSINYLLFGLFLSVLWPFISVAKTQEASTQSVTVASTRDPQWMSYRKAHYTLEWLESYPKPKNYVRLTFHLWPKDLNESTEGVQLELVGEKTRMVLPFELGLQVTIPKLKEAYEEDAEFRINRRAGTFFFQNTGSIKLNANGIYPIKELRIACNQLLSVLRDGSITYRLQYMGKECKGVEFIYPKNTVRPSVFTRDKQGNTSKLENFIASKKRQELEVAYRFSPEAEAGEIISEDLPIMIHGIYE